jgi:hypothetical protein
MTETNDPASLDEARLIQRLREDEARSAIEPSTGHDAAILVQARTAAGEIRGRGAPEVRPGRWWLVSLAATLLLGVALGRGSWLLHESPAPAMQLTVPVETVRGSAGVGPADSIPVERVDPAVWYRYIQELVFSGQVTLAEEHLRRFRQLHPDFVYQP